MRWRLTFLIVAILSLLSGAASGQPRVVRIGVVEDGPSPRTPEIRRIFQYEINRLLEGEFDIQFPEEKYLYGDWTADGVRQALARLLADPEVDIVFGMGVLASYELGIRETLPKPVIAPVIVDPQLQGLPLKGDSSGKENLSYISFPPAFARDMQLFRDVVPFQRLAVLIAQRVVETAPGLAEQSRTAAEQTGAQVTLVPIETTSVEAILAALPQGVDAVSLLPLLQLSDEEIRRLADALIRRRIASFSVMGPDEVRFGVLMTSKPDTDFPRLARRTAINLQRILLGEKASEIPVSFVRGERITINMATARALGIHPSYAVRTDAVLLNEQPLDPGRRLSLEQAVREAIAANLDLKAADRQVAAGAQEIRTARSSLLPQVEVSTRGLFIDRDRAAASFGSQPQRSLTGTLSATQLIYSDQALANVTVQKNLQERREEEREQLRLDIALSAASGYLNVLRAKTLERVQKENLQLTRANLERATIRRTIGLANPSEVYRWEAQMANDRRAVLDASAQLEQARLEINRILNRPQEEAFDTVEASLDDPVLVTSQTRLFDYLDNPYTFRLFRDFSVQEGLQNAPELRQLEAGIAAQQRVLLASRRAFYAPTIAAQAGLTGRVAQGGAGTSGLTIPVPLPMTLPKVGDVDWQIALQASLPLFTGGARRAAMTQAEEELARLRTARHAAAEQVEARIRSALHLTGASFPGIQLAEQAAEAARKNYELVADAYSGGAVTITDLLEAQNAALAAEQNAANAVFDFLLDLMRVQRATGKFDFFTSTEEREAWFGRLEKFFAERQSVPKR